MRSVRLSALLTALLPALLPAFVIMVGLLAPGPQRAAALDAPVAPTPPADDPPIISFRVYLPQLLRSIGLTASFPPGRRKRAKPQHFSGLEPVRSAAGRCALHGAAGSGRQHA